MILQNGFIGNDYHVDEHINSLGHRCKEIKNLNFKDYILFAGDNIGLGLGTPIENTYPHIVSQKLNCDYYNLCVFNGGLDAIKYNLISWFTKFNQKPRALIVSCEFANSLITSDNDFNKFDPINLNNEHVINLLDAGNLTGYFRIRHVLTEIQLKYTCQIPIYQITFENKIPVFDKHAINIPHTGNIFDHNSISETLHLQISKIKTQMLP